MRDARQVSVLTVYNCSVAKAFINKFAEAADSHDPSMFAADFEHVSIDVHVPVLDIPNLPVKQSPRHLTKAVIQGKFEIERRDYTRIFQELIQSLNGEYKDIVSVFFC